MALADGYATNAIIEKTSLKAQKKHCKRKI